MRIDSSGNVGIGPGTIGSYGVTTLDVNGAGGAIISVKDSSTGARGFLRSDGSSVYLTAVDSTPLLFSTVNTERMRINTAGALAFGGSANTGTTGQVLTSQGSSAVPVWGSAVTAGTSVVTTSGLVVDFTGFPSWVKQIMVLFDLVSTTGTSPVEIRLGSSGGFGSTTYNSSCQHSGSGAFSTTGLIIDSNNGATQSRAGAVIISNINSNTWVSNGSMAMNAGTGTSTNANGGRANLSGVLTQLRIITQGGADTFDAGRVNIMYQ
jgi:hypothetical protein